MMIRWSFLIIAFVLPLSIAQAKVSSSDNSYDYYITVQAAYINFNSKEPEGNTADAGVSVPLNIGYELALDKINRLSIIYTGLDFSIEADPGGLGLSVDGYQITTKWERRIRYSRKIKPWFGLGLITNSLTFKDRHTTDENGFLDTLLGDRVETSFSLLLSASMDWEISHKWYVTTNASYQRAISDGLEGYGVSGGIKYKF